MLSENAQYWARNAMPGFPPPAMPMDMIKDDAWKFGLTQREKFDWERDWTEKWTTRIGLRGDLVSSNPDPASNKILSPPPAQAMILADQNAFNSAYRHETWEGHLECVWAGAQNRVSDLQGQSASPGYGLLNFRLAKIFAKTLRVEVGFENLLDKRYAEHLGGVNRVSGGDLAVGERIPSAGASPAARFPGNSNGQGHQRAWMPSTIKTTSFRGVQSKTLAGRHLAFACLLAGAVAANAADVYTFESLAINTFIHNRSAP